MRRSSEFETAHRSWWRRWRTRLGSLIRLRVSRIVAFISVMMADCMIILTARAPLRPGCEKLDPVTANLPKLVDCFTNCVLFILPYVLRTSLCGRFIVSLCTCVIALTMVQILGDVL